MMEWGIIMVLLAWIGYLLHRVGRLSDDVAFEKFWQERYQEAYRLLVERSTQ